MKRLPRIASLAPLLLLSLAGDVGAAGPYDGEWAGSATSSGGGRCRPASVTLTVQGKMATGRAQFEADEPSINGTVLEDGTLGATIGFQRLTGKFGQGRFEGSFKTSGCEWKLILERRR